MTIPIYKTLDDLQAKHDPAPFADRLAGRHAFLPLRFPLHAAGLSVRRRPLFRDQLQDILIRNSTPGIEPAVAPFVLVQQSGGGFVIEDAVLHTIPPASQLTPINSVIRLHDLNADGFTDMLLSGLNSNVQGADRGEQKEANRTPIENLSQFWRSGES